MKSMNPGASQPPPDHHQPGPVFTAGLPLLEFGDQGLQFFAESLFRDGHAGERDVEVLGAAQAGWIFLPQLVQPCHQAPDAVRGVDLLAEIPVGDPGSEGCLHVLDHLPHLHDEPFRG